MFKTILKKIKFKNKNNKLRKLKKREIPYLKYGVIHSQIGYNDGVSIVIKQMESVMLNKMKIPKRNIFYLVGSARNSSKQVTKNKILWHRYIVNRSMINHYRTGYRDILNTKIEKSIKRAEQCIERFINRHHIDVVIAHNTSHPVNFIISAALSRYYNNQIRKNKRTPKYILWWHDSHLEIKKFQRPSRNAKKYLLEGVPGAYVEHIIFINSTQFNLANDYFLKLNKKFPGFYNNIFLNHSVIPNTADILINSYDDLKKIKFTRLTNKFLDKFKIRELLKRHKLSFDDVQFCLQHSRVVPRKKIDFAIKYCYKLLDQLQTRGIKKAMVFFISGYSRDEAPGYKKELINLNARLARKYKIKDFFLVFAEDCEVDISFKEMPYIFANLGGIATYFSETEGFGNNLLEILAGGLIPIIYTYPVFITDIAKYKFKIVCLDQFKITPESINSMIEVIQKKEKIKDWAKENIVILKRDLSYKIIAPKLNKAIIGKRLHI